MAPPSISMACSRLLLLAIAMLCLAPLLAGATASSGARLPTTAAPAPAPGALALAEWLDGEGSQQCWEALMEIKSCTGEIILFLLNGEAYLGPGCCRAIRVIEKRCWAADAMLSVIGFTPEEGDMLKGYCDAGEDNGQGQGQQQQDGSSSPPPRRAVGDGDDVAGVVARGSVGSVAGRKQGPAVHR